MSNKSIAIIGRLADISIAELESLYGAASIEKLSHEAVLINADNSDIDFNRLGGTVKLAKVIENVDTQSWPKIESLLLPNIEKQKTPDTKMTIGLSLYGFKNINSRQILSTALKIKKTLRNKETSVRIVPNKTNQLSSVQVFHNSLTSRNNLELCIVAASENKTYISKTTNVQDIDAYSARDQMRPKRDARVGMLPPKLAQTIINLATGSNPATKILDPFCGTGVILQEAALMGLITQGSDIDERMVEFSKQNIEWLAKIYQKKMTISSERLKTSISISQKDATNAHWDNFDVIASEAFLGRPLNELPEKSKLQNIINDVNTIITKFLINVSKQIKPGARLCIAVPAWKTSNGFIHLPMLDSLEKLGYNRVSFAHADTRSLIYYRDEQVVTRELLVITRK